MNTKGLDQNLDKEDQLISNEEVKAMKEGTLIIKKSKDARTVVPNMKKIHAEPKINFFMDVEKQGIT